MPNRKQCDVTQGLVDLDRYAQLDGEWRKLKLAAPARRGLVDAGLFNLKDLTTLSLEDISQLHAIGPWALEILKSEMKRNKLSFQK